MLKCPTCGAPVERVREPIIGGRDMWQYVPPTVQDLTDTSVIETDSDYD